MALAAASVGVMALVVAGQAAADTDDPPVNIALPRISGHPVTGKLLVASHGKWTGSPSVYSYHWQRCTNKHGCSTIAGATGSHYRLRHADVGHRVRVVVKASNGLWSKPARSKPTAKVTKPASAHNTATPATAYQLNAQHSGYSADSFSTRAKQRWSVNLGGPISYPLVVGGRVFVIADDSSGPSLYALNAATGKQDWGEISLGGSYGSAGLTYDAGRVFTINSSGTMEAFTAATGALDWAVQLPKQWMFTSPPTAFGGLVYTGGAGSGGTVFAVRESSGAIVWSQSVMNGDDSSPAVSSTGVYVSYACGQTYDFSPASGSLIWWRQTACEGGGGRTPVLANGLLYVRDSSFPAVLHADTGSLASSFRSSGPAPAVSPSMIFNQAGGVLTGAPAAPPSSVKWSFTGDGTLSSAPVVAGSRVIVAGTSGRVYAVSSSTGKVLWRGNAGAPVSAPDEHNAVTLTGLAQSGGLLVVPAGSQLVAFR